MPLLILLGIIVLIIVPVIFVRNNMRNKEDQYYEKINIRREDVITKHTFILKEGLSIPAGTGCVVMVHKDQLLFHTSLGNTYKLKKEQILGSHEMSEKEILEKSKSSIGRAVVGGVALGPLGAVVGAISGTGSKKKKKMNYYTLISYVSQSGEDKTIILTEPGQSQISNTVFINSINNTYGLNKPIADTTESSVVEL